jgi:membrane protein insertase Oxa1/YidC/SpoIIIJ
MTTVQPMASAMNLTAPAPTFMNKLRAGNRPTLFKVGIVIAILIAIVMFMRGGKSKKKRRRKEKYSMDDATDAAKKMMKKIMR